MAWRPMGNERVATFLVPLYDYEIVVILCSDVNKSRTKREKQFGTVGLGNAVGLTETFESGTSVIFLPHKPPPEDVAHECYHAVCNIMAHIGAKLEEEVVAYTLGYLVRKVTDFAQHK